MLLLSVKMLDHVTSSFIMKYTLFGECLKLPSTTHRMTHQLYVN